jgi:hypothetical protein
MLARSSGSTMDQSRRDAPPLPAAVDRRSLTPLFGHAIIFAFHAASAPLVGSLAVLLRSACFGEAYRLTWGLESSSRLFEHR